jgi:hypothetical protein
MWTIRRLMMTGWTAGKRKLSVLRALQSRTPALPVYSGQQPRQPVSAVDRADAAGRTAQIGANYNEVCPKPITYTANSRAYVSPVASPPDAVCPSAASAVSGSGALLRATQPTHPDSGRAVLRSAEGFQNVFV